MAARRRDRPHVCIAQHSRHTARRRRAERAVRHQGDVVPSACGEGGVVAAPRLVPVPDARVAGDAEAALVDGGPDLDMRQKALDGRSVKVRNADRPRAAVEGEPLQHTPRRNRVGGAVARPVHQEEVDERHAQHAEVVRHVGCRLLGAPSRVAVVRVDVVLDERRGAAWHLGRHKHRRAREPRGGDGAAKLRLVFVAIVEGRIEPSAAKREEEGVLHRDAEAEHGHEDGRRDLDRGHWLCRGEHHAGE
mmetsp:Transcript_12759/g.40866  ORF Transcript_12759/g.40866 Transcript_12759/m.40866 type:complete len:248 (+) Transcript_12759:305-1048(+)